jgi:hypothetical protein
MTRLFACLTLFLVALTAESPARAFELPPRESFDATVQRPLFFPSRRAGPPPEAAPTEMAPPAPDPAGGVRLIGVATDRQGRAVAVLRAGAGTERRVVVGDAIQGWRIESIDRNGLGLGLAGHHASVLILGMVPKAPD